MLKLNLTQQLGELSLEANLEIPAQGVTAIFGRSGAGKSSLINLVAGLSHPDSGSITLGEKVLFDSQANINLPPEKRKIGYVFQEPRLFPHYTIEKNLKYGVKHADNAHFKQIIQLLGIESLLARYPAGLSGGEKQRVAIGRALLSQPDILLMDEPLSALDLPRKKELLDYLATLAKSVAIPILYVTHSLDEIVRLADRLILIERGKIIAFDTVNHVWHSPIFTDWQPDSQKMSLLELPISQHQPEYHMLGLAIEQQQLWIPVLPRYQFGKTLRLTIASKDVSIVLEKPQYSSIRNILRGEIVEIEEQQDRVDIAVKIGLETIWASISLWSFDEMALTIGQSVYIQIKTVSL